MAINSGIKPPSRESRSRLGTKDSNSYHHRGERGRSGSPTEFYRHQITMKDTLYDRMYDMNAFIHKGIDAFLDKQAVRDLIIEFDNDDIYIGGEDMFFSSFEEMGDSEASINFSRSEKRRFMDVIGQLTTSNQLSVPGQNGRSNEASVYAEAAKKHGTQRAVNSRASPWSKPRSSLWNSFFSLIRIKVFNIQYRSRSALRRRRNTEDIFANNP